MVKNKNTPHPPKWADRFLAFYCNPELLEQIQGDVHELFYYRLEEKSAASAKRAFVVDVLRFFRWSNIKRSKTNYYHHNNIAMFKNYLKIGWRNLLKQKGPSSINIFGLSCAIACCIVAYLLIEGVWLKGMYHKNKNDIYLLTHQAEEQDEIINYGVVSSPIAELTDEQLPSIKRWTRANLGSYVITHKSESFLERTLFVDPAFMDMFTYKIAAGYGGALNEPQSVIITHSTAQKFFGDAHPIGQTIHIIIKGEKKPFVVGGVLENLPSTSMLNFEVMVNNQNLFAEMDQLKLSEQWRDNNSWLFVQLEKAVDPSTLHAGLQNIVDQQNEILPSDPYLSLQLAPFTSLVKQAKTMESGPVNYGSMGPQILLGGIALFMLTLAVFNYINISVLMASKRLKEIGIRKVIGGKKSQLVFQFLSENLILCLLALVMGALIAATLFIPWFNQMASKNLQLDLFNNFYLWLFLVGLLVFVALVSGIYPAFYIASFKPITIFSGKLKIGNKHKFTGVLLTFQFVLAIITIVAALAFVQTNRSNEHRDWGYLQDSKIVVNVPSAQDYLALRDAYTQLAEVTELAGSQDMIGHGLEEELITFKNKEHTVDVLRGAPNYPQLMDLRLKEGRFLNTALSTDIASHIVVNQAFMESLHLQFPVEEVVTLDSVPYRIVGVVEDFHSHFFTFSINPMVIMGTPEANFNYLTLKFNGINEQLMADKVRAIWHQNIATGYYQGALQASVFDVYYEDLNGVSNMLIFTSILATLLSVMGLFGLVSLNINAKMKDISIMKIMGASLTQLTQKLFKHYFLVWIIACLAGSILAAMVINLMLDSLFAFHSGVNAFTISLALVILFLAISFTVGTQVRKVSRNNPADTLKAE